LYGQGLAPPGVNFKHHAGASTSFLSVFFPVLSFEGNAYTSTASMHTNPSSLVAEFTTEEKTERIVTRPPVQKM
jgi:hypothetical protein